MTGESFSHAEAIRFLNASCPAFQNLDADIRRMLENKLTVVKGRAYLLRNAKDWTEANRHYEAVIEAANCIMDVVCKKLSGGDDHGKESDEDFAG